MPQGLLNYGQPQSQSPMAGVYGALGGQHITPQTMQQIRTAQAQATTPQFNQNTFNGLNDAQKFVYLNSLPRGQFDGNTSVQPFMGANWNNIDYNGLINGMGANQLTWDFGANQIRGPQGLLSNPTLSYTNGG